jgi:integral membrane protein (TIGR01906 family)
MRRQALVLSVIVGLAVPAALLGNGLWLLVNDWYVHAEYARPGFPDDRYGLTSSQRTELALVGLDAIHPFNSRGVDVLREARLPEGGAAFNGRELVHMSDVRGLVGNVLLAHLLAVAAIVTIAFAAHARRLSGVVSRGLLWGSGLTLGIAGALGLYMLANFDGFFVQFHEALFTGDTWRFRSGDTLLRLYPDAFWSDFAGLLAGLTVLQAIVLGGVLWRRRRRLARARALAQDDSAVGLTGSTSEPKGWPGASEPAG